MGNEFNAKHKTIEDIHCILVVLKLITVVLGNCGLTSSEYTLFYLKKTSKYKNTKIKTKTEKSQTCSSLHLNSLFEISSLSQLS